MLSIQNISAGYGTNLVLQDVSLDVGDGEFLGLIGPNGSGKTTLLRVLSGVLVPKKGRVLLKGVDLENITRRKLAQSMAFLAQEVALDFSFTVRDVALMGRSPHLSKFGRESREDLEIVEQAMTLTGVSRLADRIITELSGGERQRTMVAMCLAQQPEVLVLDEPTSHLDIAHQLSILDLIRKLNHQSGMTVIGVFHDLNLAAEYCERLVVLDRGRVQSVGSPEAVLTADTIRKVYQAEVLVQRNPVSDKPHVVISADGNQ